LTGSGMVLSRDAGDAVELVLCVDEHFRRFTGCNASPALQQILNAARIVDKIRR